MKSLASILLVSFIFSLGCVAPTSVRRVSGEMMEASVGVAEMKIDRTIVLRLRGELPGGGFGEGYFVYPPSDPDYQMILDHVGPLSPGQSVSVRPWPDQEKRPNQPPQRNAGSRPSSDDSSASETPSSLGPRG